MFTDFRCPFCSKAASMMEKLRSRFGDDVRIAFKHHPMQRLHPDAIMAHEASWAAHAQGRFWDYHDKLFARKGPIQRRELETLAAELGLNVDRFKDDLDRHAGKPQVHKDMEQGASLGVHGTPTMFINGRKVVGANWKLIEKVVRFELRRTSKLMESGVQAERIYQMILDKGVKTLGKEAGKAAHKPPAKPGPRVEDPDAVYRVELGNSTVIGAPEAPVTVVMFVDYQCPFSAKANETVKKLIESAGGAIRLVIKNNPQPRHPGSPLAAEAALAAGGQGKFRQMHDLLFAHRDAQSREDLEGYAKELGLDMKAFKDALESHTFHPLIEQEQKTAQLLGATSTPTYFVNGRKLKGNQPYDALKEAVEKSRAEAEKLIAAGTAAKDVYEQIIKDGVTSVQLPDGPSAASIPPSRQAADPNIPL
jgi:protein-disulfide isomerase